MVGVISHEHPTLTVFTPAYNRADTLPRAYEALKRQTSKDFLWVIVNDGSTDDTEALVQQWLQEPCDFEIRYIGKANGGMYTGYKAAIAQADTELCVCVDSDDYLTDNAVELIITCWRQHGSPDYAGIVGLDCLENGEIIGDPLPQQKAINLLKLEFGHYRLHNGDRKNVFRTDLYQAHPMPDFPGERDWNPHYVHLEMSRHYDCLVLNEPLCVVDYRSDGMHGSIFRQYLRSPNSFRDMRLRALSFPGSPLRYKLRHTIHYISACLFARKPIFNEVPNKLLTFCCLPFGILWHLYLCWYNARQQRQKS